MPSNASPHILILGAGINGAALARELALSKVDVTVVDTADIAFGATSYSSRLIHGGLRYLEYGEFDLVKESLEERSRLLRLAPQFVHPLRLFIPVDNRFGGLGSSAGRFLGWNAKPAGGARSSRGLWLVRTGLWLYDHYARASELPRHAVHSVDDSVCPRLNRDRYRWSCSYHDAQIRYPERFVMAMLEDARRLAEEAGSRFRLLTYHRATLDGDQVEIRDARTGEIFDRFKPAVIVNATGAWVDLTLGALRVASPRLMGGTKGSHFLTWNDDLRQAVSTGAIYAEAGDGRPIFILPFGDAVLVGTTDERYTGDPALAKADQEEIAYLIRSVNSIVGISLAPSDVSVHYCGVRPLPHTGDGATAGISRRHWMEEHSHAAVPMYSIIGGKLTTCRSLAESSAATLLARAGVKVEGDSRSRPIPGAENYPTDQASLDAELSRLAAHHGRSVEEVSKMWSLLGSRTREVLAELGPPTPLTVSDTTLSREFARWVIRHEWVARLGDLIERRLMLVHERRLTNACLRDLADLLVEHGLLAEQDRDAEIADETERLKTHFGRDLAAESKPSHP